MKLLILGNLAFFHRVILEIIASYRGRKKNIVGNFKNNIMYIPIKFSLVCAAMSSKFAT